MFTLKTSTFQFIITVHFVLYTFKYFAQWSTFIFTHYKIFFVAKYEKNITGVKMYIVHLDTQQLLLTKMFFCIKSMYIIVLLQSLWCNFLYVYIQVMCTNCTCVQLMCTKSNCVQLKCTNSTYVQFMCTLVYS